MKGVIITTIEPVNLSDDRGRVYELFKGLPGQQVTVFTRKRGVVFGNHFHKGIDPSKDPEYFFLVQGEISMSLYNGRLNERETLSLFSGQTIVVPKGIYHSFEAVTDVICIEYRATIFDPKQPDCFPLEEYAAFCANSH